VPRDRAPAFVLRPTPPFRLDLTVWALRRRARNQFDRWDGVTYQRVMVVTGRPTEITVRQEGPPSRPRLIVTATPSLRSPSEREGVSAVIDRLLGLRVDLDEWYRIAKGHKRLRTLADRFRGVKPPRFPTVFEALVNAFACQQLSLIVGLELLNRLGAVCNVRYGSGERARYAFPAPRDVARFTPARYRAIGFSRQKVHALLALARGIDRGDVHLEHLALENDQRALTQLRELRGVGRWTAEYVLLRGLGRLHVFPGDDVGAQKSLGRWLGRPAPLDYQGVTKAVRKWQPYAGLLYFHLLLDGLSRAGAFNGADAVQQAHSGTSCRTFPMP
jgi:DNA-3-methyladenine glycosylase II